MIDSYDRKYPSSTYSQSVSAAELSQLAASGNLFTVIEMPVSICLSEKGQPLSAEEVVIKERIYSVAISINPQGRYRVSVTRGGTPLSPFHPSRENDLRPDPPELLTVELEFDNEYDARECFDKILKSKSDSDSDPNSNLKPDSKPNKNPILALETYITNNNIQYYNGMKYPGGNIPFHLSGDVELPESASSLPEPSLRKDPLTQLMLRPGFIRLFDLYYVECCDVITVGEIDVANLGVTNEVCGREFGDKFFCEVSKLTSTHNRIKLFRHGGDEFSFAVFGYSEEFNKFAIESFIADVNSIRDSMMKTLSEQKKQELLEGCAQKAIKKGRAQAADPLDLYVGIVSICSSDYRQLCKEHEKDKNQKGIVVQSLLGQAEKAVYNAKVDSNTQIVVTPPPESLQLRSSDCTFISSLREIDKLHNFAGSAIKTSVESLSKAERIILYRIMSLISATDVSVNNWITRSERFDEELALIGQDHVKSSSIYIDFPAGILNDRIGPERTDEFFTSILSYLPIDYPMVTIRESGGGFKLIFPVNKITDKEIAELKEQLTRRIYSHLDVIIENINYGISNRAEPVPNEKLVPKIPLGLLYVGRDPRPAEAPKA